MVGRSVTPAERASSVSAQAARGFNPYFSQDSFMDVPKSLEASLPIPTDRLVSIFQHRLVYGRVSTDLARFPSHPLKCFLILQRIPGIFLHSLHSMHLRSVCYIWSPYISG